MVEQIRSGLAALAIEAPAAPGLLAKYGEMLIEKNQVMNLTAITEPSQVAALHFLDSAALLTLNTAGDCSHPAGRNLFAGKSVIDVGTGAGFPGLPLRVLEPSIALTLLDTLGKRVDWLREVCGALGTADVTCIHARAEEQALEPGFRDSFDFAVSRAVADLRLLCELCLPYVKVGGKFLAMKSVSSDEELSAASDGIRLLGGKALSPYDYTIPGTDVRHRVIVIEKVSPTPKGYPRRWAKMQKAPL